MGKLPSFQFYPGDWMKDPDLRRCSKAAKGVWIDMLCLMFECPIRGVLADVNGNPWSDREIAEAIGGPTDSNLECIEELLSKGVASRNARKAIFSRRLVREETKRMKCVEAGKKGGNPVLTLKGCLKGEVKGSPKGEVKPELTPSSSSSFSTSKPIPPTPLSGNWTGDDLAHNLLREAGIVAYGDLPRVVSQALTLKQANSGWPMEKVFIHVLERACAAKSARYRGKWVDWFAGGDYDKPPDTWAPTPGDAKHVTVNGQVIDRGFIPLKPKARPE